MTGWNDNQTIPLEIGNQIVEITPPFGYPGYGYPKQESTGVKDPLNSRLVPGSGERMIDVTIEILKELKKSAP